MAALAGPLALGADHGGGIRGLIESLLGSAQHKVAALGERAHAAAELVAGQKVAAVAASAAALAGGGAAAEHVVLREAQSRTPAAERQVEARPAAEEPPAPVAEPTPVPAAPVAPEPEPAATEPPAPPKPEPAQEFDPVAAQAAATPSAAPGPADGAFSPGSSAPSESGGGGEFAP